MQFARSDLVVVRQARWRLADIRPYESCQLLKLTGADPGNAGADRFVLLPFDTVEAIHKSTRPKRVSAGHWRRACRALLSAQIAPEELRTAALSRIELLPYQLEPALAVIRGATSRVLIADDVGLGKTVQAGLILTELRSRGVDRALIVTPAGLRDQWSAELASRFDVHAPVVDTSALRRAHLAAPVGTNPWRTFPAAIASVDFVKRPEVLTDVAACRWELVIVDEAHGVCGDSERHAAVHALCARAAYVVLLTATPHSGDREAFRALCGLGAAGHDAGPTIFRRTRHDVQLPSNRRVHRLLVGSTIEERRMHAALALFCRSIRKACATRSGSDVQEVNLALATLQKRALSSAWSLHQSVLRRLAALDGFGGRGGEQLALPLDDREGELAPDDDIPGCSPLLTPRSAPSERRLLESLRSAAAAAARHESKLQALHRILRRCREPVIVFTEYRDTLAHVAASLREPAVVLHGGLPRDERIDVLGRFVRGDVRLLLATDAAGEGLNLHHSCRLVVNLELPWNPMRLEQRIGRVDRIGQNRTVHAIHLIARHSAEIGILHRLGVRVDQAHADAFGPDPISNRRQPGPAHDHGIPELGRVAAAEASRVRTIRAIGQHRAVEVAASLRPVVATTNRATTRAVLKHRALTIWRIGVEDGGGRRLLTLAFGALVDRSQAVSPKPPADVETAIQRRVDEHIGRHIAFVNQRLARERGIAGGDASGQGGSGAYQPGLFDRRADRARLAVAAAARVASENASSCTTVLEKSLAVSPTTCDLALILLPD